MSRFRTWLQLVRAPNLFTVPGDPLAGYLLASFGSLDHRIFYPVAASLCFYAGGLLLNDLADLEEDRIERPRRPLPSGAASKVSVAVVTALLFALGLAVCALVNLWTLGVGSALLTSIVTYNHVTKHVPGLGVLNMGLCRGLSLLLGATAVNHGELSIPLMLHGRLDHLLAAFCMITFYIAAVTHLARFETRTNASAFSKWLPAAMLVAGTWVFLPMVGSANRWIVALLLLLAIVISAQTAWQLTRVDSGPLPPAIGQLIRLLLPIQAAFCAASGEMVGSFWCGVLIFFWPLSRALGQRFYAS